jgi:galactokinase
MSSPVYSFAPGQDAEAQWQKFETSIQTTYADWFDGTGPIVGARAPGRLDVLGGVADYSGSMVLEMPIAEGACVAWQWREDRAIRVFSTDAEAAGMTPTAVFSLDDLMDADGYLHPIPDVRRRLTADPQTRWSAYIVGCLYVMLAAYGKVTGGKSDERLGDRGANILVSSTVPLGAGVSSSAAIEVATMHALSEAAGIHPSDLTLAAWCQRVENRLVGAPSGIMDQVTAALGEENALLVLRCQPHDLLGTQIIPPGWKFVGIDSGVKHSVGGVPYALARVGAFIGLKYVQIESGKTWDNYLCRLSPREFAEYSDFIPETLTGAEYHANYDFYPDSQVTRVDPDTTYRPRACAEHPVLEMERAKQLFGLMQIAGYRAGENPPGTPPDPAILRDAGQLMYAAHASYSERLDLGAPETDLLVQLVQQQGEEKGLFGAKITGGGSGGTVAILCTDTPEADAALVAVCEQYHAQTGIVPRPIVGSSPGAVAFGARYIVRG